MKLVKAIRPFYLNNGFQVRKGEWVRVEPAPLSEELLEMFFPST